MLMGMIAGGIYLTNSRGGIIGAIGMVAGYAFVRLKGTRRTLAIIAGVLLVTMLAPSRFSKVTEADTGRLDQWIDGLQAFHRAPVFGVGFSMFAVEASTE